MDPSDPFLGKFDHLTDEDLEKLRPKNKNATAESEQTDKPPPPPQQAVHPPTIEWSSFRDFFARNSETDEYEELESQPAFPYPKIDDAAFYGPFGRIVKAIEPLTEADPIGVLVALLIGWGNLIGRSAYFSVGADRHYTNLNCCIVGRTARARKGLGFGVAGWVLAKIDEKWFENHVSSGLSSGEGLIWRVRDPITKQRWVKATKNAVGHVETYIEDQGITDKRLTAVETEFGSTFAVMGRNGNTLSAVIRDAFDSKKP
jgi:hypothetical protein